MLGPSRLSHAGQTSNSTIGQTRIDARDRGVRCSSQSKARTASTNVGAK